MAHSTTTGKPSLTIRPVVDGQVKGTKLGAKLVFLRDTLGTDIAGRVVSSMDTEDQDALRSVYDVGWYPIQLYGRLLDAIVRVAADGDDRILEDLGRHSAEEVAASYPSYYRTQRPVPILEKMIPLHSQLNDPGEMELIQTGPTSVAIIVKAPAGIPKMCRVARAFYLRTLELCRVNQVAVDESSCSGRGDELCRFDLSWT